MPQHRRPTGSLVKEFLAAEVSSRVILWVLNIYQWIACKSVLFADTADKDRTLVSPWRVDKKTSFREAEILFLRTMLLSVSDRHGEVAPARGSRS